MIGIYKITKKDNGKSYIGQSNDIKKISIKTFLFIRKKLKNG